MLEDAKSWVLRFQAEPELTETGAVTFRQVLHLIMCIMSGHRTGIWSGLTVKEFEDRVHRPDGGSDVTHMGGKNRKSMGGTTLVLDRTTDCMVTFYLAYVRPLLRKAGSSDALLPGVCVASQDKVAAALGVRASRLQYLTAGNNCRRFHSSLSFHLQEQGKLSVSESRLLAFYRRHSASVAELHYEQRSRRELDSGAQRGLLAQMSRLVETEADDLEAVPGPSGLSTNQGTR